MLDNLPIIFNLKRVAGSDSSSTDKVFEFDLDSDVFLSVIFRDFAPSFTKLSVSRPYGPSSIVSPRSGLLDRKDPKLSTNRRIEREPEWDRRSD